MKKEKTLKELNAVAYEKKTSSAKSDKQKWRGIRIKMTQENREILENYANENYKSFSGLIREITMKLIKESE